MSASKPPRLGRLLLKRFGPDNAPLVGDLAEEYRSGRSQFWYWQQVVTAIAFGAGEDIKQHWWLALRAIGIGWVATWVCWELTRPMNGMFSGWLLDQMIFKFGSHPFVMLWATDISAWPRLIAASLASGSVVAGLHRQHPGLLLAFVGVTLVTAFVDALPTVLFPLYPGHVGRPNPGFYLISRTLLPPLCSCSLGECWPYIVAARS